ncbi:MAG TPA: DUF1302 family protein [Myxococcota bacterium]|nr:DUF1302 family protein [Myxococcota bacterium]
MTGSTGFAPRRGSLRAAWLALALIPVGAHSAHAVDALDGRLELHGHVETQVRAISEKFSQELDLAQWYNVLDLEIDAHVLPQGWGPINVMSAHVRAEGRYDAIYSHGFGIFPSINTYGNNARRLPQRLRDAKDPDLAGVTPGPEGPAERIPDKRPAPFAPIGERRGIPDYDIFFRQAGGDDVTGTADDPARYANAKILDYRYALTDVRGPAGPGSTRVLGPWLPKNILVAEALGLDRANPLRGRIPATAIPSGWNGATGGAFNDPSAVRFFAGDPQLAGFSAAQLAGFSIDALDPNGAVATALFAPDSVISELSRGKCERAGIANCTVGTTFADPDGAGTYTVRALNQFPPRPLAGAGDFSLGTTVGGLAVPAFGGDFSGIVPCLDPTDPDLGGRQRGEAGPLLLEENSGCIPGSFDTVNQGGVTQYGSRVTSPQNIRFVGGRGEAPFRPAPDRSSTAVGNAALLDAQGLYLPSVGLRHTLRSGDLDPLMFNVSETDRAWNRGAAQERTKELKEAYLDFEAIDHRLWMRVGLQNIVWGKTEVFRVTDQWNPQDLGLSSLPTLEESRIALWSARAIYSLYDVGPLQDVRLEVAANLDKFVPADLGACGEPYAADSVCSLTYAIATHSYLGVGIAGVDRPETPWKDPSDLEIGGRIEWRWDRFTFALTDFWGHSDLPYADAIFFYDRSVDPATGRPVVARLPGQALGTCVHGGQIAPDPVNKPTPTSPGIAYSTSFASHPYSVTTAQKPYALSGGGTDSLPDGSPLDGTTAIRGGIGSDPDCLRPGGAPGFANAYTLDPPALVAATNALQFQSSNQQLFAWSCLATVGIASALEPSACAWTFFASGENLRSVNVPIGEAFATMFAGDPDGPTTVRNMQVVHNFQKDAALNGPLIAFPVASLNRLANNPQAPFDRNANGVVDNGAGCADDDPSTPCDLGGFDGFDTRTVRARFPGAPTLDSSLTNEQRALLGCGPFYGVRCDSAARETNTLQFPQSGPFGGLDFMNMEASVLVQSWLGVEGTLPGQTTSDNLPQPGTIGPLGAAQEISPGTALRANVPFLGGPACTRFVASQGLVKLPGCRGIAAMSVVYTDPNGVPGDADDIPTRVQVQFEAGYLPSIDGCIVGDVIRQRGGAPAVPVVAMGASAELTRELALCSGATTHRAVPEMLIAGFDANQNPIQVANPACAARTARGASIVENGATRRVFICRAEEVTLADLPLIHPTAGCIDSPTNPRGVPSCFEWANRDLVAELFAGTAQLFQNELAAFSDNFLAFLAISSCDLRSKDLDGKDHNAEGALAADPECFLPTAPYQPGRCSLSTPQLCKNVKNFLAAVGVTRNTVRAAGNERFGRRTFIWHSGGEVVLRYDQHNVLGFATDFAEDHTQTSWGFEFTWVEGVPYSDADALNGISNTDELNFAVSVDRPTFIRFVNADRPVLFNTQWFVTYLSDYRHGFTANGPVNAFFTFAMSTGYYQDRLIPQLLTVYEFASRSGGVLPSLEYRFTDSLSITGGMLYFFGRTELSEMAVREVSPVINRAGPHAYRQPVENGFSGIRKRDEVFVKLRWTF